MMCFVCVCVSEKYNGRPSAKIRAKMMYCRACSPSFGHPCPSTCDRLDICPTHLSTRSSCLRVYSDLTFASTMAGRKRLVASGSSSSSSSKKPKRQVSVATFDKWRREYERDYQAMSWLRCDVDQQNKSLVAQLWCDACRNHEGAITGMKNFSKAWITGSSNQARLLS